MAALVAYVAVRDDDGIVHSYGPGDDVPDWAKPKITNPKVWEGGDDEDADDQAGDGGDGGVEGGDDEDADDQAGDGGDGGVQKPKPVPPPKGGKGSGEENWRKYAEEVGVDVSEAQDRDDIITILELAEVPTE